MRLIIPSMKFYLEPFWTQQDHTLPYLTLWSKEDMWCDWCVWLHSAEIQQRHQDYDRHIYRNRSQWKYDFAPVMWWGGVRMRGVNNLQETLWGRFAASGQLFVCACCFLRNRPRTAGWERSGKVQWRKQSWAAGTSSCAPARQKHKGGVDWH